MPVPTSPKLPFPSCCIAGDTEECLGEVLFVQDVHGAAAGTSQKGRGVFSAQNMRPCTSCASPKASGTYQGSSMNPGFPWTWLLPPRDVLSPTPPPTGPRVGGIIGQFLAILSFLVTSMSPRSSEASASSFDLGPCSLSSWLPVPALGTLSGSQSLPSAPCPAPSP